MVSNTTRNLEQRHIATGFVHSIFYFLLGRFHLHVRVKLHNDNRYILQGGTGKFFNTRN